jgi:hypothetical protein
VNLPFDAPGPNDPPGGALGGMPRAMVQIRAAMPPAPLLEGIPQIEAREHVVSISTCHPVPVSTDRACCVSVGPRLSCMLPWRPLRLSLGLSHPA